MSKFECNLKIVEALKLTCQALASLCRSDKSARCTLYVYYMGCQERLSDPKASYYQRKIIHGDRIDIRHCQGCAKLVARCSCRKIGQTNFGQILDKCPIFVQCWIKVGQILDRYWANVLLQLLKTFSISEFDR